MPKCSRRLYYNGIKAIKLNSCINSAASNFLAPIKESLFPPNAHVQDLDFHTFHWNACVDFFYKKYLSRCSLNLYRKTKLHIGHTAIHSQIWISKNKKLYSAIVCSPSRHSESMLLLIPWKIVRVWGFCMFRSMTATAIGDYMSIQWVWKGI